MSLGCHIGSDPDEGDFSARITGSDGMRPAAPEDPSPVDFEAREEPLPTVDVFQMPDAPAREHLDDLAQRLQQILSVALDVLYGRVVSLAVTVEMNTEVDVTRPMGEYLEFSFSFLALPADDRPDALRTFGRLMTRACEILEIGPEVKYRLNPARDPTE